MLSFKKYKNVKDKGIYLGVWKPKDEYGRSLGLEFNLYAAPQNLMNHDAEQVITTFGGMGETLWDLSQSRDKESSFVTPNHPILMFNMKSALVKFLKLGQYEGQWFVPTENIMENFLLPNINKGDLKNIFIRSHSFEVSEINGPRYYHVLKEKFDYSTTHFYAPLGEDSIIDSRLSYQKRQELTDDVANTASIHLVRAEPRKKFLSFK